MNTTARNPPLGSFRHEALFYAGEDGFLSGTVPFIREGVERGEPVLVVVNAAKIDVLLDALNGHAEHVQFADMAEVGRNPARIIPAWREFVNNFGGNGRRLRGIGEPISAERSDAALAECHRHESLLNLAFADSGAWWLLCPYDTTSLPGDVIEEARRTHPFLAENGTHRASPTARDLEAIRAPFDEPLAEPPPGTPDFVFDTPGLAAVRLLVREKAHEAGFTNHRASDAVLAANEIASNSLRHGGGTGVLRVWTEDDNVICDLRDSGEIEEPLVGRIRPIIDQPGGRGMWLANQLCELVQVRSSAAGTIVRLHIHRV
jgi:anti-sigma regulatory factor (Ser/Thr protein kinase)